jgi:hypothetical protein
LVVRRRRPDVLQSLGGLRILDARQIPDVHQELPSHRVPQIRPRLRVWDAWGVALLRIGREQLIRRGIAVPDLQVHLPACDRKSVFRAAARFQWLEEVVKRWTLCRPAGARFAASPCGAARGQ